MKNKRNKKIQSLAQSIIDLEQNILLGKDIQESKKKIENIVTSLSFEDMLLVDNYIMSKKLLTK